ncbi:MAG: acetyltransferase [Bryobacteraceae bacterium]
MKCSPLLPATGALAALFCVFLYFLSASSAQSQFLVKPTYPGEPVSLLPSDVAILESGDGRTDLPCSVTPRKADVGFDLRFHTGYDATIPLNALEGDEQLLTVVFRVYALDDKLHPAYFVQHFRVPHIDEDAKGEAALLGIIDVGEGNYHVDWLMRDRGERVCSSSWDVEAALAAKDKSMNLFIAPSQIAETASQPFVNEPVVRPPGSGSNLNIKLLVNFAPQTAAASSLQRIDTDPLVSILKAVERDPHIGRLSLVAFNMEQSRVIYRQEAAEHIDFPALGKALETMKLGTVNVQQLKQKHGQTDFLEGLIEKEVANSSHPDAVIFAGPKAMLDADVPQDDLRRIGDIECPVFYLNYNLNPQAVPWKDSISHAIRVFKGTEYTISRPRDLWFSTAEMVSRILRSKRQHAMASAAAAGSQ